MSILILIKDAVLATLGQLVSLFGGVVLFGLLIHFISQLTFKSLERSFGRGGTYLVAWLGTPIHELGHAVFCLIFLHKITAIAFFKPDPVSGTLGYVTHSWNRSNPWQVLGNFFIGIGPVLLGCLVLLGLFYFMVPDSSRAWEGILARVDGIGQDRAIGNYFTVLGTWALDMTRTVFTAADLADWRFWLFCYLAVCVASNIRLSPSDVKGAFSGLGCVVLPFLLINIIGLVAGFSSGELLPFTASSLGLVYSMLILSLVMVSLGFLLIYPVTAVYVKLRKDRLLNPF